MSFKLPCDIRDLILQHALNSVDVEVCGLLAASGTNVVSAYLVDNIAEQPASNFYMQPEGQIAALKKMRMQDEQLCAIYHSHPRSEAIPSVKDREQAAYPGMTYLIISLMNEEPEIRAYHFDGEDFNMIDIEITS